MTTAATVTLAALPGVSVVASVAGNGVVPGEVVALTGAQTYVVDLAMMPAAGCKCLVVTVDALDATGAAATAAVTVQVTINGTTRNIPAGVNGGAGILNPAPTSSTGVTALSLISTASAVCRVAAYG